MEGWPLGISLVSDLQVSTQTSLTLQMVLDVLANKLVVVSEIDWNLALL